jgi:heme A synthase
MRRARYVIAGYVALVLNLLVVGWGAYVRASGSGAGCGRHWPVCNGEVVPRAPGVQTLIEFTHRLSSGVVMIAAVLMYLAARRLFAPGTSERRFAGLALVFMLMEALLGAGLVLFGLVARDDSLKRAFSMSLHLCNTFCLLSCITAAAYVAQHRLRVRLPSGQRLKRLWPLLLLVPVGVSGAIAALGDTLFPANSLGEGLRADIGPGHIFLRLRTLHPVFAIVSAGCILAFVALAQRAVHAMDAAPRFRQRVRLATALRTAIFAQMFLGFVNVVLLAPIPLQLAHLVLADIVFVLLAMFVLELCAEPANACDRMPA